jgi:putative acyl-CoA dehydrogenase
MTDAFATHEVFNQSPPFEDVNLFTTDKALMEAVAREGGGHAAKRLAAFGAQCGSAEAFNRGRLANEHPPRLKPFDAKGRRLDVVEFHPAYHECMELSIKEGLHCSAWDHLAKAGGKPVAGANVARSAGTYMAIQMEAGHQCPITMTNAAVLILLRHRDNRELCVPKLSARARD